MTAAAADFQSKLEVTLGDREWRLDNLYFIQDPAGKKVPFRRNDAQRQLWENLWYLNVILKARQLGMSTQIIIALLDICLFNSNIQAGIIDLTLDDAKAKLEKALFAYNSLPDFLKSAKPLKKENTEELQWANGSGLSVGTSHRGGTLQYLHVSEFGKIAAQFPDKAREIKTGAFGTIHKGQYIFVESTAEGNGGAFFDMVQTAEKLHQQGLALTELDFRLHFFPWWKHSGYRLDAGLVLIEKELADYFDELAGQSITLDADQKAWYARKRTQIGFDDMFREYPSTPEEAFKASIEGAYFKTQMSRLRLQKRIGRVPHDPGKPVNTFWDIGKWDSTTIWFHQSYGNLHHLIDYYENSGEGVEFYARILNEKREKRGFVYGRHLGPHDLDNSHWTLPAGRATIDVAKDLGIAFEVVPRVADKMQAIEATRNFLSMCWIDEEHCARGIQCLDNYRKEWDERLATFKKNPLHDWASHGADGLETGACGFTPEYVPPPTDRYQRKRSSGSAWAA